MRSAVPFLFLLGLGACTTYRDDLARGERAFDANSHEQALAIFRTLEPDTSHLTAEERATYSYLRGMTDYRIGYKADARHWLALARAMEQQSPGTLHPERKARLDETLTALNDEVYGSGIESLSNITHEAGGTPAAVPAVEAPSSPTAPPKKNSEDEP